MRTLLCGLLALSLAFSAATDARPAPAGAETLAGRVVTGTAADAKPVRRARVTLTGRGQMGPRITDTDAKGAYRFDRLPAGEFTVAVQKPGFVKLEAAASATAVLTMDRDGVEVVLTPKVSRLSGTVSDDKGPVDDYAVVLFASDPTKWIDRSRFVVTTRPTQQGRFELRGLPPEDYLAVALPAVSGTEWMDPEFLQQLRAQATSVTLGEGEARTLDLKLKKRP